MKKIIKSFKDGTLFKKIFCFFLIKTGFSNNMIQALEIRNKNYNYIKRKYGKYVNSVNYSFKSNNLNKNIWICWFQGEENAPNIVKKCINSVKKYMQGFDIHIIDEKNMNDYVELPTFIIEKWEKGIISYTHLSDILRTELLIKYGGLWIDSTVLLTDCIPNYIFDKGFFLYRHSIPDDITITYNNWLIYSEKDNPILIELKNLFYIYWKKENKLRDYFLFHLFLTLIYEKNSTIFNKMFYLTDELPETLARIIFSNYDAHNWEELKKITCIHKLSNKFDMSNNFKGSYFDKLLK